MGLIDGLTRQLRSVIEWQDTDPDQLFYKWSDNGDEIKNASKLIIGPGQGCIFVYEGVPKAMIVKSGIVNLETDNVPFWTTIKKVMNFFESEHKVGIYYFKTTRVLDQKWGTNAVVKYEDPKYHFPVGLRAFGNYSFRIRKPGHFFVNFVGSNSEFTVSQFREVMNSRMVQPLTDHLAQSQFTYVDIDANRDALADSLLEKLKPSFTKLGFMLTDLRIEGTNFDEDTWIASIELPTSPPNSMRQRQRAWIMPVCKNWRRCARRREMRAVARALAWGSVRGWGLDR